MHVVINLCFSVQQLAKRAKLKLPPGSLDSVMCWAQGEAYACCNLGVLHYGQRQYEDALTYFERFFEAARALKDQHVLDVARVNLGAVRAALTFKDYIQVTHWVIV